MNLVRKILLAIEASEHGHAPRDLEVGDFSKEQVGYHVLLLGEAGLLIVTDTTSIASQTPSAIPHRLTWEGHEFIDASRSESVWATAMKRTGDVGGTLAFSLLKTLLESILKSQLGL